jgi:hypothetical protein
MAETEQYAAVADSAEQADERARRHARLAYEAIKRDPEGPLVAVVDALLALEARIDELSSYVARLT